MSIAATPRIVAVVVAYNRADLLVEALDALAAQTLPLDRVVVIDNASDDSTPDVLSARGDDVLARRLPVNTGGAGGFTAGLALAVSELDADLVWLMDDDTIPTPTALEELIRARSRFRTAPPVLASKVVWTDGSEHPMNTPRSNPFIRGRRLDRFSREGFLPVRSSSFVSMLIDADVVRDRGLPIADYFIWNDDFEYSTRLIRGGTGVYAPRSVVLHKTKVLGSTDADPGPRFYYEVRNKIWMFRSSRGLGFGEKLLYGASSLLRWVRTFARSKERGVLWDGLRRGLRDGFGASPRSNADVLEGSDDVVAHLRSIEAKRGRA